MNIIQKINALTLKVTDLIPQWAIPITIRLGIFFVFWNSAQSRLYEWSFLGYSWKFWEISETSFYLFDDFNIPLIPAEISTYMATFAEFFLSLFIVFGFFTRLSAAGLLGVVFVIQVFAMPDLWQTHLLWASALLYLFKYGAGSLSVDQLINNR